MSSTLGADWQRGSAKPGEPRREREHSDVDVAHRGAGIAGVHLSFHPWEDNGFPSVGRHRLIPDHDLLDAFAREYANDLLSTKAGAVGPAPEMQDFFLLWLQNRLSNIAAGTEDAPAPHQLDLSTAEGMGTAQWLAHLIGYYAAVWLRACWTEFEGPRRNIPMHDRSFAAIYSRKLDRARDMALRGSDQETIEFSRAMLRKNTPLRARARLITRMLRADRLIAKVNDRLPGEVGIFGYNAGYLRHVLPPSLNSPINATPCAERYYFGDPNTLLDAHFALEEQPFLSQARATYAAAGGAGPDVVARLNEAIHGRPGETDLLVRQQNWDSLATAFYRIGVPGASVYRGFDQVQYDRLLAWTSYAVMNNVANGYNALSAYSTQDAQLARRHITASTLWWGSILTYVIGCVDGRTDGIPLQESLPRFTTR
jgi:hypothetical protein